MPDKCIKNMSGTTGQTAQWQKYQDLPGNITSSDKIARLNTEPTIRKNGFIRTKYILMINARQILTRIIVDY